MTITFVGSSALGAINGASITLTLPTINAGDQIIVANCVTRTGNNCTVTSSNGTAYTPIVPVTANGNLTLSVWQRTAAASETTATASGSGSAQDGDCACYVVVRGIGANTIVDSSMATGTSANPNSPAVTIGSTSAFVISFAASLVASTVTSGPSGYTVRSSASGSDTRSSMIACATNALSVQGSEDPGTWVFTTSAAWLAVSVGMSDSGAIFYPLPPPFRDPPDFSREMIGY